MTVDVMNWYTRTMFYTIHNKCFNQKKLKVKVESIFIDAEQEKITNAYLIKSNLLVSPNFVFSFFLYSPKLHLLQHWSRAQHWRKWRKSHHHNFCVGLPSTEIITSLINLTDQYMWSSPFRLVCPSWIFRNMLTSRLRHSAYSCLDKLHRSQIPSFSHVLVVSKSNRSVVQLSIAFQSLPNPFI